MKLISNDAEDEVMIPAQETERLVVAAITATAMGRNGQQKIGLDWLTAGLDLAREYERAGVPWALSLIARWRQVIDAYCTEFDLKRNGAEDTILSC
jgi:hypothetical protein